MTFSAVAVVPEPTLEKAIKIERVRDRNEKEKNDYNIHTE